MSQKVLYKNFRSRMDIWKDINHFLVQSVPPVGTFGANDEILNIFNSCSFRDVKIVCYIPETFSAAVIKFSHMNTFSR